MPREIVCLQIGQCGNQLGLKWWDLLLQEQISAATMLSRASASDAAVDALGSLFYSAPQGNGFDLAALAQANSSTPQAITQVQEKLLGGTKGGLKARCIPIDMEEGVLNAMVRGPLGRLFDQCHLVSDVSGAGNNWAIGYMEYGDKYVDAVEESVRLMIEKCDSIQTFIVMHSLSGGTGSGFGTRCLAMLDDCFPHIFRCSCVVMPSEVDDVVTAPYNTCFALREVIERASCVIPLDNDALAAAADRSIRGRPGGQTTPNETVTSTNFNVAQATKTKLPFDSMNAVAAQMLSNLTCSMRFPGALNMDINEIATNLVPYPRIHFLQTAIAPLSVTRHSAVHGTAKQADIMFSSLLERDHQLLQSNPKASTCLGAAFICRGVGIDIDDVNRNVPKMRERGLKMIHWNTEGFKTALCSVPPLGHPQSALMLSNHCGIAGPLTSLKDKFMRLYSVRSHVHHYQDYVEMSFFDDTMECMNSVISDYTFLNNQKAPTNSPKSLRDLLQ